MSGATQTPPAPPKHLSLSSRKLWRKLLAEWTFTDTELVVLRLALEAADRCEQARKALAKDGLTVKAGTGAAACGASARA